MEDITKQDLYKILGVDITATEKEIKKAYRKKALSCHPDKNPNNPKAAELFQQLSKALEILLDISARAAYDRVIKAKKANEIRNQQLDSKRKKLKDDLEAREQAAQEQKENDLNAAEKLEAEIKRLREEGSRQLEEEKERLKKQIEEELQSRKKREPELPRIKVSWKSKKSDETNGGYNYDKLAEIFRVYGNVTCVMSKKNGRALIEYPTVQEARAAFNQEHGLAENPLTLTWIQGKPCSPSPQTEIPEVSQSNKCSDFGTLSDRDYESLVLMKLRQAEERKRLIQQMKDDDE